MFVPDLNALISQLEAQRRELAARGAYVISDIDPPHAEHLFHSLLLMAVERGGQRDRPITLYINSGGGSVGDGLGMMEFIYRMRREHDVRIDTVVLGYAYSMGAIVLQAGDRRSMGRFSTLMLHATNWILSGDDQRIFKDFQRLAEHYQDTVAALFAARTGHRDTGWWRRFIWSGRDRFLGPEECLELGLVDEVVEPSLVGRADLMVPPMRHGDAPPPESSSSADAPPPESSPSAPDLGAPHAAAPGEPTARGEPTPPGEPSSGG
ncbi:MAG TPA: ATP-dependent Clp protease proteolytic subunit [Candidatus Limnocylindrales bacterium]|nr:ATP-dependent Clp protease proteolytic subunit [Candidatus Limnocylindrales bacterium]